jgi:hypothetical protein
LGDSGVVEPAADFLGVKADKLAEPLCFHQMHDSVCLVIAVVTGVLVGEGTSSRGGEGVLRTR